MDNNSKVTNTAAVLYEYSINPDEPAIINHNCAVEKASINVLEPLNIVVCMEKCKEFYRFYIKIESIASYPVDVWLRIMLPSYMCYDPYSFVRDGTKISCVNLYYDFCVGVIQPDTCSTVSFLTCIDSTFTADEMCIDITAYYNIIIPYKAGYWACIDKSQCFNINSECIDSNSII